MLNEYVLVFPVEESTERSSTHIPLPLFGARVFFRSILPQPSLLLGISREPTSLAPKIISAFTKAP